MKRFFYVIVLFLLMFVVFNDLQSVLTTRQDTESSFKYEKYIENNVNKNLSNKRVVRVGLIDGKVDEQHYAFSTIKKIENVPISEISNNEDEIHANSVLSVINQFEYNNNMYGMSSGAYTEIYNVSVLNKGVCKPDDLVKAISYCLDNDVEIINISIAFKKFPQEVYPLFEIGRKKNVLFIFSNGNLDRGTQKIHQMDNVIFVGATNNNFKVSSMNSKIEADFYFPGVEIFAASEAPNSFEVVKGTTYSAAIATGFLVTKLQETSIPFEIDCTDLKDYLELVEVVYK